MEFSSQKAFSFHLGSNTHSNVNSYYCPLIYIEMLYSHHLNIIAQSALPFSSG